MLLAVEATQVAKVHTFDFIVLLFTIVIAIGVVRQLQAPQKNKLAIGFGIVSLAVFLFMDVLMIANWLDMPIMLK